MCDTEEQNSVWLHLPTHIILHTHELLSYIGNRMKRWRERKKQKLGKTKVKDLWGVYCFDFLHSKSLKQQIHIPNFDDPDRIMLKDFITKQMEELTNNFSEIWFVTNPNSKYYTCWYWIQFQERFNQKLGLSDLSMQFKTVTCGLSKLCRCSKLPKMAGISAHAHLKSCRDLGPWQGLLVTMQELYFIDRIMNDPANNSQK